eukprot:jgi/Chrzof1/1411/Cz10g06240.t1
MTTRAEAPLPSFSLFSSPSPFATAASAFSFPAGPSTSRAAQAPVAVAPAPQTSSSDHYNPGTVRVFEQHLVKLHQRTGTECFGSGANQWASAGRVQLNLKPLPLHVSPALPVKISPALPLKISTPVPLNLAVDLGSDSSVGDESGRGSCNSRSSRSRTLTADALSSMCPVLEMCEQTCMMCFEMHLAC